MIDVCFCSFLTSIYYSSLLQRGFISYGPSKVYVLGSEKCDYMCLRNTEKQWRSYRLEIQGLGRGAPRTRN